MKNFLKFALIWYSQQMAIPFWVVGHIHLSIHTYHNVIEILSSLSLNLVVAAGFFIDYQENGKK
tara:strand:- start:496 stop:687 length:192 start_codon:yes stop_codon:yes gene_type:complete